MRHTVVLIWRKTGQLPENNRDFSSLWTCNSSIISHRYYQSNHAQRNLGAHGQLEGDAVRETRVTCMQWLRVAMKKLDSIVGHVCRGKQSFIVGYIQIRC